MYPTKLYFNSAIKALENQKNRLVWFFPWNGIVRNDDGEEIGEISSKVMDRIINSHKCRFIGTGTGLLNHEKYYKLKVAPAVL
jgi:hypothetical protein